MPNHDLVSGSLLALTTAGIALLYSSLLHLCLDLKPTYWLPFCAPEEMIGAGPCSRTPRAQADHLELQELFDGRLTSRLL